MFEARVFTISQKQHKEEHPLYHARLGSKSALLPEVMEFISFRCHLSCVVLQYHFVLDLRRVT